VAVDGLLQYACSTARDVDSPVEVSRRSRDDIVLFVAFNGSMKIDSARQICCNASTGGSPVLCCLAVVLALVLQLQGSGVLVGLVLSQVEVLGARQKPGSEHQ
jgi:hypothetical protein